MVDRVISFPARVVENGLSSMGNLINTFKRKRTSKRKIDSYNELAVQNNNYKREIDSLKQELNLNETLANYEK